ncbi:MAG: GspH/FimT family pseudopilin [Burkholderiales bacterium]
MRPGSRRRACRRVRGLTLLELLVTISILGIALGAVSLSLIPAETRRVDEEIDRLAAVFRLAQDETRLTGQPLTWRADRTGYRFVSADGRVRRLGADDPLRPRTWPFEVRQVDAPAIRFGREPLLPTSEIRVTTPTRGLVLVLDAFGALRPVERSRP